MQLDTKQLKKISILYVEDDESVRKQTLDLFTKIFKNVIVAVDGEEGIEKFKNYKSEIDIIVTDINMPNKDGLTMVKEINQISNNVPVIITTAHDDLSYLKDAIDLNVDKYFTKPIQIRELTVSIVDLVSKYKRLGSIESLAKNLIEKSTSEINENQQLKQKNEFQQSQLAYYETIIDTFVLYFETDKLGNIKHASKKFFNFFGFNEDEIIGKNINLLKCSSCKGEGMQQLMLKAIHLKKTLSSEQTFITNDGKTISLDILITPLYGADMLVNGYKFYLDQISTQ